MTVIPTIAASLGLEHLPDFGRPALESPVELPSTAQQADTALPAADLPKAGQGIVIARIGDLRIGTLLVDSVERKVLGRVTKWSLTGSKLAGKPLRRKLVLELEEDPA